MNPNDVISQMQTATNQAIDRLKAESAKLRTGRAHPSMLENVVVEAYGQKMPLIQVGQVTAPDATLIQITPFDPNNVQAIAQAIREDQSLGLNPTDDGKLVRVPIPPLTEERRQDIVKQLHVKAEDAQIALRQARQDALKTFEAAKKDKDISEDDYSRYEKQVEDAVAKAKAEVESFVQAKEKEILTF